MDIKVLRCLWNKKRKLQQKNGESESHRKQTRMTPTAKHSGASSLISPSKLATKAPCVCDKSLDANTGNLRHRLDHLACFHCPEESDCKVPSCALHQWVFGQSNDTHSQTRENVFSCKTC